MKPPSSASISAVWALVLGCWCVVVPSGFAPAQTTAEEGAAPSSGPVAASVMFASDLDVSTFMSRASEFAAIGKYETAAPLIQKVLDAQSHLLVPTDAGVYRPSDCWTYDLLLSLPAEALDTYRTLADPRARALYNRAETSEHAEEILRETAQRFFLSAVGDEAAYRLACRRMTRGQFALANRWFTRLLDVYPEPDMPRAQLWLRGAVAAAMLDNRERAEQRFARYKALAGDSAKARRLEKWLRTRFEGGGQAQALAEGAPMPWGNPRRDGIPTAPDFSQGDGPAACAGASRWELSPEDSATSAPALGKDLRSLIQTWRQRDPTPTDKVIFDGEHVVLSNSQGVRCISPKGYEVWSSTGLRPFRELNNKERRAFQGGGAWQGNYRSRALFDDHLEGRVSLLGDTLYRIEGAWATGRKRMVRRRGRNPYNEFTRDGCWLAAYDKRTGHRRYALGGEAQWSGARFLNAPVPCGRHLLVAYEQDDSLRLLAFRPDSGEVVWTRVLCSYAADPRPPTGPAGILVNSGAVYLLPGEGVVFAVDGYTGEVDWAAVYERLPGSELRKPRHSHRQPGWDENALFLAEGRLLVLPSDAPTVLAFDPLSGAKEYRVDSHGATRALGVMNGTLYAGALDRLVAVEARGGRLKFERSLKNSTGRGLLTSDGILQPVKDRIDRHSLQDGTVLESVKVGTDGDIPLGNLATDGSMVYAAGLGHLLAIAPTAQLAETLNAAVRNKGAPADYLARGNLRRRIGRFDDAVQDLKKAYELPPEHPEQQRMTSLRRQLCELDEEEQRLLKKYAWFSDDFQREQLGENYTVELGEARMEDGALYMNAEQNMLVRLNRQIPGNFRVTVTGWQPKETETKRLCDLSFKMDIDGPERDVEGLYAQFGTNWNVRNKLQVNGHDLKTTTDYLMQAGTRHKLELTRLASFITLVVDGVEVINHSCARIPEAHETLTTLCLYGFGGGHYYDDLTITRLNPAGSRFLDTADGTEEAKQFKQKQAALADRRKGVHDQMAALRQQGYTGFEPVREALFRALIAAARHGTPNAGQYMGEARELAASDAERQELRAVAEEVGAKSQE